MEKVLIGVDPDTHELFITDVLRPGMSYFDKIYDLEGWKIEDIVETKGGAFLFTLTKEES